MGMGTFVEEMERRFAGQIAGRQVLDACAGQFEPFPDWLHPKLQQALRQAGVEQLYSHQVEALNAIRGATQGEKGDEDPTREAPAQRGHDTVLVSQTASGKTLSFLLPILDDYLKSSAPPGVMLLYPTKALARDQEGTLGKLPQQRVELGGKPI